MKSNNTDIAVNWFMALPFDERIAIANKYYPQYAEDNTDLDDAEIEHIYFSEYPILPDYITWWKGLNEEEKYKLCCKHFQGIPVESLMERSIKVMYHYENPETTTNTVTGGEVSLSEEDINTILDALMLAKTRYNHIDNGGIFYDGAFKDIKSQNEYAQSFFNVECTVRRLAKQVNNINQL